MMSHAPLQPILVFRNGVLEPPGPTRRPRSLGDGLGVGLYALEDEGVGADEEQADAEGEGGLVLAELEDLVEDVAGGHDVDAVELDAGGHEVHAAEGGLEGVGWGLELGGGEALDVGVVWDREGDLVGDVLGRCAWRWWLVGVVERGDEVSEGVVK